MLHSIYDLTTFCRPTTGDVPAKLVGASTTVVGSKMYLFGGRLVSERRMVSDLYSFDLQSFQWEKLPPHPDDNVPRARYFHSADTWNNRLVIFGGMSNQPDAPTPDELCVLNDVRFFDLATLRWLPEVQLPPPVNDSLVPRERYAHLSSVTADRLFIIGGQDFFNTWLDDVCVYDLVGKAWVQRREYPRHCGTYRSVAVSANMCVRLPQMELRTATQNSPLGPPGARFRSDGAPQPETEYTSSESLIHLPYSSPPTEGHPSDIYLYSNYNFTDVKRELEVFSPLPDTDFTISDRSDSMSGTTFPPGLRFPTGAILGTHLIIAGTYLAHSYQSFSIWVLDLLTMSWSRIDPGKAVETGSWFRGSLWAEANKFLIFGNRHGNLVDDYNRRLLSWDHVAVVDLEAFGIYQAPPLKIDVSMQELGLAALEEKIFTDFNVIADDGRKVSCSRKTLEERWPWLKEQLALFNKRTRDALQNLPSSPMHLAIPDPASGIGEGRSDPRLTPRSFQLSEPYPITLALMQYFYSLSLITPLQHAPAVLSQLLVLATNYKIFHLEALVKHAMHRALSNSTSVGVYEVATLCNCRSLQIRALKTVMSYTQKRPGRSRNDRDTDGGNSGSGSGPNAGGGGSGPGGPANGNSGDRLMSRPRGTSDARWPNGQTAYGDSHGHKKFSATLSSPLLEESAIASDDSLSELRSFTPRRRPTQTRNIIAQNRNSIVSLDTENDMQAITELLTPTIATFLPASLGSARPESEVEPSWYPEHDLGDKIEELYASHSYFPPDSPGLASSSDDDYGPTKQQVCVPAPNGFHLPRRGFSLAVLGGTSSDCSDTPSLVSSSGSSPHSPTSSVRTPSVGRNGSLHTVSESQTSEWLLYDDDYDEEDRVGTPSQKHFLEPPTTSVVDQAVPRIASPTLASPHDVVSPSATYPRQSPVPPLYASGSSQSSLDSNPPPSPSSPRFDSFDSPTSPTSPVPGRSLRRFLSPKKPMPIMVPSSLDPSTIISTLPFDTKSAKADAKRRRKEENQARAEALTDKLLQEQQNMYFGDNPPPMMMGSFL